MIQSTLLVRRYILCIFIVGVVFYSNVVMAQEVTVTGMGSDRDSALRDATRLAVEQVVGTFITSETVMKNLTIQLDEVYKKSQGFINNIRILDEGMASDSLYRVKAAVDVDTNPNAELINTLTMIMRLNDPRIVVVVLEKDADGQVVHDGMAESALNSKLVESGFSNVLDAAHVINLKNSQLLKSIYDGSRDEFQGEADHVADFLVIGSLKDETGNVAIPKYNESGMLDTSIMNSRALLKIDVISYSTGKLIDSFLTEGTGIGVSQAAARSKATSTAAKQAAVKLIEKFKKHGAKNTQGTEFVLMADNEEQLYQVMHTLRSLTCVDNVYIREQNSNTVVLDVESVQKPHEIVRILRNATEYGIAVESINNARCQLRIK
ncbi:hypothetical protein [Anaerovibrio sp.]|uniref:hypothetical protein n=1 Tax=Anaerovibrio sp. TaxID=1872532 RepID=UPI0025B9FDEA|nr:hypothetical protein [Anaerovibrio sp.]MBR2142284.1 hypothetical protein [Anaerovibrio sp.]